MWLVVESEVEQLFGLECSLVVGETNGKIVLGDAMFYTECSSLESGVVPRPLDHIMVPFFGGNKAKALEFATRLFCYPYSLDMFKKQYPEYVEPMIAFNVWASSVSGNRAGQIMEDMLRHKTRPQDAAQFSILGRCGINELATSMVNVFQKAPPHTRETLLVFVLKYGKRDWRYNNLPVGLKLVELTAEEKIKSDKKYEHNKKMACAIISFILHVTQGRMWIYTKHKDEKLCMTRKDLKRRWNEWVEERDLVGKDRTHVFAKAFIKTYFFGNQEKGGFIYFQSD